MKTCRSCQITKSLTEFQKRSKNKDGHTSLCKECKRKYDNQYYKNNDNRKKYIKENRKNALDKATKYIYDYLKNHPCIDCGESDPVVLEFDHIKDNKIDAIANMRKRGIGSVKREIEKCEVRCANCHRRKTAKQFKWQNKMPL